MNKRTKKPVPLAVAMWRAQISVVRLVLPTHMVLDLKLLLQDVCELPNIRTNTAPGLAREAAKMLASEMLCRTPWLRWQQFETELRITMPRSEALTLLAWLLSSDRTDDAAAPLRLLIDALYQLLS